MNFSLVWMRKSAMAAGLLAGAVLLLRPAPSQEKTEPPFRFVAGNRLEFPADYREWIFLSSGRGMTYGPSANPNGPPLFDNVFVHPAAYREFVKTGQWPDRTIFVLEIRNAATEGSINKGGQFQKDVAGIEVEVKDQRLASTNGWGFFRFDSDRKPAEQLAQTQSCYTCHRANGAVEQTFVQFYPTLIPIAMEHKTFKTAEPRN